MIDAPEIINKLTMIGPGVTLSIIAPGALTVLTNLVDSGFIQVGLQEFGTHHLALPARFRSTVAAGLKRTPPQTSTFMMCKSLVPAR